MGSSILVMFIGVPLIGRRRYGVRRSEEANGESEIPKYGLIRQIFGSFDGVYGC